MKVRSTFPCAPRGAQGVSLFTALLTCFGFAFAQESPPSSTTSAPSDPGKVEVDANAANVTSALQGQDGVRIQTMCTHCNSANIQVGGLSQDLVPITFGGFPLFGGLATSFALNMLPSDAVAEAQVQRGPGSAGQPAQAAGGVIDLAAAKPKELPWVTLDTGVGSFARRYGTLRAAGPITPWLSGALTLGRETADKVDADDDGWTDVAEVRRNIADARVYLNAGRDHRFELGASYVDEKDRGSRGGFDIQTWFANGGTTPYWTDEDTDVTRKEYRAGWTWRLPSAGTLVVRGLYADRKQGVFSEDTAFIEQEKVERYKIHETNTWASLTFRQPIGLAWRVTAGLESNDEEVGAIGNTSQGVFDQEAHDDVVNRSGNLEIGYTPTSQWDFGLGARYDRVELKGRLIYDDPDVGGRVTERSGSKDSQVSPRVSVRFRPIPGVTLRALAGKTFRAPKPIFSEVCCGRKYISNAEAGLRPEEATTYALEGLYQPSPALKVTAYASRTSFDDYLQQLVSYSFFYRQIYANANIPKARAKTAEASVRWSVSDIVRLDGSIGWLVFDNTGDPSIPVRYKGFFGGNQIQDGVVEVGRIPYRPMRSGALGVTLTFPQKIDFALQGSYTGPQLIQQWDDSSMSPQGGLQQEMREIGGFWLINLSINAPLWRDWVDLSAGIDNLKDSIQSDLGDPTRDYNWGPLTGRSYRLALRFRLDRQGGAKH